jgi:cytochrome c oxidase subunit II
MSPTSIFAPASTPAAAAFELSMLVIAVTGVIFVVVSSLLVYALISFRRRTDDDGSEPAQVYGSHQIEIAWTIIPILIVVVLFLASARVITTVQDAREPAGTIEVEAVGHQYWWEYRYPKLGIVTANELHVPVSDRARPTPTFLKLLSADTDHSFWLPRLAGKTDLIPNRVNRTWIDPYETGLFLGQCAQYCGTQHAKMLLRVYVDTTQDFDAWVRQQRLPARDEPAVAEGKRVFQTTACVNCHAVSGTIGTGQYGPDLTHLMSRQTLASGILPNTPQTLKAWIRDPEALKPGSRMPAMKLTDNDLDALTAYLVTLR